MKALYKNVISSNFFMVIKELQILLTCDLNLILEFIWSINWGEWISTLELIVRIAIST